MGAGTIGGLVVVMAAGTAAVLAEGLRRRAAGLRLDRHLRKQQTAQPAGPFGAV
jgi:hypothetical protein